jgi:nitrous oxidase accessory protein NosD
VPAETKVAVVLATVQMEVVVDAKVTGRPEVDVAERVRGVPTVWAAMGLKVMVCAVRGFELTVKLCETGVAAA